MLKHQDTSSLVIISLILVTCMYDQVIYCKEKLDACHYWGLKGKFSTVRPFDPEMYSVASLIIYITFGCTKSEGAQIPVMANPCCTRAVSGWCLLTSTPKAFTNVPKELASGMIQ